jgi:DNA-3-methyladenine glycosylase
MTMILESSDVGESTLEALSGDFYACDPHQLARRLLGRDLVRLDEQGGRLRGRIIEVEVYGHCHDPASHANTGVPTDRTSAMFGPPGTAYIYLIYGMYHCLNVVAPAGERPAAVLIRALHPLEGLESMARRRGLFERYDGQMPASVRRNLLSGPGKICQAMGIDLEHNEQPLGTGQLRLARGVPVESHPNSTIACAPRIGLNPETVGEAADWPWRYGVSGSRYLSRPL